MPSTIFTDVLGTGGKLKTDMVPTLNGVYNLNRDTGKLLQQLGWGKIPILHEGYLTEQASLRRQA